MCLGLKCFMFHVLGSNVVSFWMTFSEWKNISINYRDIIMNRITNCLVLFIQDGYWVAKMIINMFETTCFGESFCCLASSSGVFYAPCADISPRTIVFCFTGLQRVNRCGKVHWLVGAIFCLGPGGQYIPWTCLLVLYFEAWTRNPHKVEIPIQTRVIWDLGIYIYIDIFMVHLQVDIQKVSHTNTGSGRAMMGLKISNCCYLMFLYRHEMLMRDMMVDVRQFRKNMWRAMLAPPCKNEHVLSLTYPVFAKVSFDAAVDFWCWVNL